MRLQRRQRCLFHSCRNNWVRGGRDKLGSILCVPHVYGHLHRMALHLHLRRLIKLLLCSTNVHANELHCAGGCVKSAGRRHGRPTIAGDRPALPRFQEGDMGDLGKNSAPLAFDSAPASCSCPSADRCLGKDRSRSSTGQGPGRAIGVECRGCLFERGRERLNITSIVF